MLLASKPLTRFVNAHPTVVVLCLSFLLMIGLSLVAEGLGFHLPKGYLYAAIGFSIMIEFFNQWARRNMVKQQARVPLRERTAESVLRLLGGRSRREAAEAGTGAPEAAEAPTFAPEERNMVSGVLTLAERTVRSVMTPRSNISWVDLDDSSESIRQQLLDTPHGMFPVCRGSLDNVIGVARAKDLLGNLMQRGAIDDTQDLRSPIYVPASTSAIDLIDTLRHARGQLALVNDEYGVLQGVVTPIDVLEAIAGEFPDEDETLEIQNTGPDRWTVAGTADLHQLEQALETDGLVSDDYSDTSVAGFLLGKFGRIPHRDEVLVYQDFEFRVLDTEAHRIKTIAIAKMPHQGAGGASS